MVYVHTYPYQLKYANYMNMHEKLFVCCRNQYCSIDIFYLVGCEIIQVHIRLYKFVIYLIGANGASVRCNQSGKGQYTYVAQTRQTFEAASQN